MATSYLRVIANTASRTWTVRGWKTKVSERNKPFSFNLVNIGPRSVIVLDNANNVFSGNTVAFFGDNSGTYPMAFFGQTHNDMWNIAGWAAFEKFKSKLGESSSLGASLAEGKQAFSMIASRAGTLFNAAKALKRLRFGDFAKELKLAEPGHQIKRKWQRAGHDLGSVWLEYSYGWKPLVGDIHDAIQVLQNPYKGSIVRGNGTFTKTVRVARQDGRVLWNGTITALYRTQYGATVNVTNPNLLEANRLGLINPLSVVWEVVPFSFVVDWFTPVGTFLENMTFGLGLSLTNHWSTWKVQWYTIDGTTRYSYQGNVGSAVPDTSMYLKCDRYSDVWTTPPLPKPRFPSFPRDRALNALSLAVTMLSSLQKKVDRNLINRG